MEQISLTSENSCGSKNSGKYGPSARNNAAIFSVAKNLGDRGKYAIPTILGVLHMCKSDSNFQKCIFKK
ncbi:hypothetical protein BN79_170 [Yersinia phage phiR2-01]|uniref:Uncharacterized protein n=1 Tax=Yersinia phage phiR2-01 TaxID=1206557 RepID=A0A140KXY3_9CAUD|nr:hypothetical protein BN79_170 [Yersinia phage phiR2-01]CZT05357.1 hypothetical protein BN79_170 [Yersinia phage phiR2-01]